MTAISIIIPTLNEADRIADLIEATRALGECEIIVVDGGSSDGTLESAQSADLCLTTPPGRAGQQNAGAAASQGDVLLFLHADCRLEAGALQAVSRCLQNERTVGGCFRQRIDAPGFRYRLLEKGNALRVRMCKWAYGDQAIFVRREAFNRIGGFPELRLMEDLYLMKRLKKLGRIALLKQRVQVSPRRWQRRGILRQTISNWTLITLAHCGISPNRLAKFYPNFR